MPYIPDHLRTATPPDDKSKVLGWLAWRFATALPSGGTWQEMVTALHRFRADLYRSLHGSRHGTFTEDIRQAKTIDQALLDRHIHAIAWMVEQEWYRRVVAPYEDTKITENGDVWNV